MKANILERKAKYEPRELSFEERLEKRWSFGTCVIVFVVAMVGVAGMLFVGNIVLGLN